MINDAMRADAQKDEEANAKLIAAARDLLAALIEVRDNVKSDSPEMWERVEAAIKKATE